MRHYRHLTPVERECIALFHFFGYSITTISCVLCRNKSTVSRELKRNNILDGIYMEFFATRLYKERRTKCHRKKILDNPEICKYVKEKFLDHQWSPEQIAGRLALEKHKKIISYNTIYRAIYNGILDDGHSRRTNRIIIRKLRHKGKKRLKHSHNEKRGTFPVSNPISSRPLSATNRSRKGHWEADTVRGTYNGACIVTLVDRKSKLLCGGKAEHKTAYDVNNVIVSALHDQPLRSVTPDRGKEFAKHKEVSEKLKQVKFYFPLPQHPWQRGTNENPNGLLREYFPKGVDISNLSEEYIQSKFNELNLRPRKCLNYRTPFEVHYSKVLHLF